VTLVVPVEGESNKFIISLGRSLRVLEWDGESGTYASLKPFKVVRDENPNGRFNDGKCDSSGRLWAGTVTLFYIGVNGLQASGCTLMIMTFRCKPGTMGYYKAGSFGPNEAKKGQLYRLEKSGDVSSPLDKIDISNGLAWSLDNKIFYYVDSLTYLVEAFDFDILSGAISKNKSSR
jgi:sugar lactone lactonase YvrE